MIRTLFLIPALTLLLLASPARAQLTNLKQNIQGKLNQAQQEREQQMNEQTNPSNPGQPPKPADNPTGWITYASPDGTKVRLYIAHPFIAPNTQPNLPALIVVQEWWGVNDDITARTDELAAKGYYAVAVDLYDGKVTKDPKEAAALKDKLTDAAALLRLKTGANYLYALSQKKIIDANRIGVIGWCLGGAQALRLATNDPRIKATIIFYGTPITDPAKLKNLKGPVLALFGNDDASIPPATVDQFEAALKDANIPAEFHRYPNAGHAFASPSAAAMGLYKPDLAKDANEKTYAWLESHLLKPAK